MAENPDPFNNPNDQPPIPNRPVNQEPGPRIRRYQILAVVSSMSFCVVFIIVFLFIFGIIPDSNYFWVLFPLLLFCNCRGGRRRRQQAQQAQQTIDREMGGNRTVELPLPTRSRRPDPNENTCSNCNQKIEPNVRFCPHCGNNILGR